MSEKTYYIATGLENVSAHHAAQALFDEAGARAGWHLTYDWTAIGKVDAAHIRPSIAIAEVEAVRRAWLLLMLLPGGLGTHTELGLALGVGRAVIIVQAPYDAEIGAEIVRSPVFYNHPLVHHARSLIEAREIAERLWHFR